MALLALVLAGSLVPAVQATSLEEAITAPDIEPKPLSGPASCLSGGNASDPLAVPFCLTGLRQRNSIDAGPEAAASASPELTGASSCKAPLYSDKCPTWAGTYDEGFFEAVTDQTLSPSGDRVYMSVVDTLGRARGGAGGGGASVVAVDQGTGQHLWGIPYDDPQGDRAMPSSMAVSPDGAQLYVTGMSFGTLESAWDFVTVAYDTSNGTQLWVSRYTGIGGNEGAFSAALSADGATLYVTGSSGAIRAEHQNYDYATVAYHAASGRELWASRYANPGNDQAMAVGVDHGNSRVFVTGLSSLTGSITPDERNYWDVEDTNSYDYATVAYDAATGAQVWASRDGGSGPDFATSLTVAPDGSGVFVTGSSWDEAGPGDDPAGPPEFATVAYEAGSGDQAWEGRYSRPSTSSNEPSALAVSPDGERLYVTGTSRAAITPPEGARFPYCYVVGTDCSEREGRDDYVTVAYRTDGGGEAWNRIYHHLGRDTAGDIAVSPDNKSVYVTGSSEGRAEDEVTFFGSESNTDVATVAYGADGSQLWVGRHNPLPDGTQARGAAVDVATLPDGHQAVVVGTNQRHRNSAASNANYGVLSYDAYGDGPLSPARPPAAVAANGVAEGSFSLMSMAHSLPSAAGGPVPWDGKSHGDDTYRYNSGPCNDAAPTQNSVGMTTTGAVPSSAVVNSMATNLTSYNTLVPGSASPTSARSHPFQFSATAPDAQGKSRLSGEVEVVACNLTGGDTVDGRSDADRPRVFVRFDATADKPATQEASFEGIFTITGGTGIYEDLTGQGQIHGYLFCFTAPNNATAGACSEEGPFRDVQYTMTGWYHDPTVPGAPAVSFPSPTAVDLTPPPSGRPGVVEGAFSLQHMIHSGRWDGTAGPEGYGKPPGAFAEPNADGKYTYSTMPCWANAPVNNVSTNLTTYNSRLPGSASPASARNQPFEFAVSNGDHPRQRKINGSIALDVCHRKGGPVNDGKPDIAREKINFAVSATSERVSRKEIRFDGTFTIVGGTGVYADLTGYGRIHGYLFCFGLSNTGGDCAGWEYRDGQYAMNGWYSDPTVAELGVGPTKVAIADDSPRSGQYSDDVTPRATLQDAEGKPIADAGVDFELAGAGGTRAWTATTDAQGVAAEAVTLDLTPGAYDLSVRYAGTDKRGPSSDLVAFTIDKEATATALSVEGQTPKRTLRAKVADDDAQRLPGVTVQFSAGGKPIGSATTDANGEATLVVPARYQGGPHRFGAAFAGDDRYLASSGQATT